MLEAIRAIEKIDFWVIWSHICEHVESCFHQSFHLSKRKFLNFACKSSIFWILSNFSQHVFTRYCRNDFYTSGACRVNVGATPAQIWYQYLKYFYRGVDLNFFSLNPVLGISAFIYKMKTHKLLKRFLSLQTQKYVFETFSSLQHKTKTLFLTKWLQKY